MFLALDLNYREGRWFTPWLDHKTLEDYFLDENLQAITGQKSVPIGNAIIETNDTSIACETCQELWTPRAPHIDYFMDGVEIIGNASGSHHELRKLDTRL